MGRTYEALKKAEAERQQFQADQPAEHIPADQPSGHIPLPTVSLPVPHWRSWFRFGRRARNGATNGNGASGWYGSNGDFSFDMSPQISEEFQQLRKNILATKTANRLQVMLLVSSRHGEGSTNTTALLAATMAQGARCVVIDANFRTPGLTRIFAADHLPGLSEALTENGNGSGRLQYHRTRFENLYFIPTGRSAGKVPYIFEGHAFDDLLGALRKEFDFILMDGAPMEMYADSAYIAPRADGTILIIQAETTPLGAPAVAVRELERVGAHILGVVLNRTQTFIPSFLGRVASPQEIIEVTVPAVEVQR
jgi:capsular exopolysaccharide synthesis family protein